MSSPRSEADESETTERTADDFPRCSHCGGRGLGLVTNPQRLCTHCAR
jgi:hypothetical protein